MRPTAVATLFTLAVLLAPAPAQSIVWTPSFDTALHDASTTHKVIVVAINMEGERANDELLAEHYKDAAIVALSTHTINVFCSIADTPRVGGVTAAEQKAAERAVRERILKIGPDQDVAAPQHLFLAPDGTVLSAVAYRVTKGELEWSWADAIHKVDPTFAWQPSGRARAPMSLVFGKAATPQGDAPPTKAEIDAVLKDIKKSRGGPGKLHAQLPILLRSPEPEAIAFATTGMRTVPDAQKGNMLRTIGEVSPKAWWEVVVPYLSFRDVLVRVDAAQALERLAEGKALPGLQKQWQVEQDETVKAHLLRAMASSGPADKHVLALVAHSLKDKSELLRIHATLAAALLEDRQAVTTCLAAALADTATKVRATAAFAIASRRDQALLPHLEKALDVEHVDEVQRWLTDAIAVVKGGSLAAFAKFQEQVLGESKQRRDRKNG